MGTSPRSVYRKTIHLGPSEFNSVSRQSKIRPSEEGSSFRKAEALSWLCSSKKCLIPGASSGLKDARSGVAHRDSIGTQWSSSPLKAKSFTTWDNPTTALWLTRVAHTARKCLLRPGSTWSWLPPFLEDLGGHSAESRVCDPPCCSCPIHFWNLH